MTAIARPVGAVAAVPAGVRALLAGPVRPATVLGSFPTALYLRTSNGGVLGVFTADALRLPLGLVLPHTSAELPLDTLDTLDALGGPVEVGDGAVRAGALRVRAGRMVSAAVPTLSRPSSAACARAQRAFGGFDECSDGDLADLTDPTRAGAAARQLLGRGSGLTPSGDDVLAGFLAAARAYRLPVDRLRAGVVRQAPERTTALSAALLRHAAAGESVPQLTALLVAVSRADGIEAALAGLVRIGQTSGRALAAGALAAAVAAAGSAR